MKVKNFEAEDDQSFEFVKEEFTRARVKHCSGLSPSLVGMGTQASVNNETQKVAESKLATLLLSIFLPSIKKPVKVKVGEKTTVGEVVKATLQQFEAQTSEDINKGPINTNPKAWMLRFAEDDGTPDDDMPGKESPCPNSSSPCQDSGDRAIQGLRCVLAV